MERRVSIRCFTLFLALGSILVSPAMAELSDRLVSQIHAVQSNDFRTFDAEGLRIAGEDSGKAWELALELRSYGRVGAMHTPAAGTVNTAGVRTEIDHGVLRQWVVETHDGLTQGFTLTQPPHRMVGGRAETGSGELLFVMELSGTFEAEANVGGKAVDLRDGQRQWTYGGLEVFDASGRQLPSRIELRGKDVILRVDDTGAAYPLRMMGSLTEIQKLVPPSGGIQHAGWEVAIDGDTAVVGAWLATVGFNAGVGKVYIFERNEGGANNWGLLKEINPSVVEPGMSFGYDVAIHGDTIVVGAHLKDNGRFSPGDRLFANSGSVYVFERDQGGTNNWGEVLEIRNPTPKLGDNFGISVGIQNDVLVAGAWRAEPDGRPFNLANGEVMVFHRDLGGADNWGLAATLTTPAASTGANFGRTVAIDNDTLVVGAIQSLGSIGTGEAYVFERDQGGTDAWGQVARLEASDGALLDRFGHAVDIDGDTLVVGADFHNGVGLNSGAAYVFERNEGGANAWGQSFKLTASDASIGDYYGRAVAVEGDTIVVGAHFDDATSLNSGSSYLYRRQAMGWGEEEKFFPASLTLGDHFGISTDISNGTVLIGSYLDELLNTGSSYIFELATRTDLAISVASTPNPVAPGGAVTYTVTVNNTGAEDATGVTVGHLFGPDSGTGSTTSGCTEDPNGAGTCTLGTVVAGGSAQYTLTRPVSGGASGTLDLTASLSSSTLDSNLTNNEVTDTVVVGGGGGGSADLLLLKQDSVDPVAPGASLIYTLQVLNNGPDTATNVVVTEILPSGVSGAVTSNDCAEGTGGVPTCTLGDILPGTSASYTVTVTVDASAGSTLNNTATVAADTDDPNTANNQANESTTVGAGAADLLIFIDDSVDPVTAGDPLSYTIDVLNNGPDDAAGVEVAVTLPASVSGAVTSGCTEDPNGSALCSLGTIAAGSSKQFTIDVLTDGLDFDTLQASVTVTSSATDDLPANNTSTEATTVEAAGAVDLFLFFTDSADPVDAGTALTYTAIIGNLGPNTAQDVRLITQIPDGLENVTITGCTEGDGGTPVCTIGSLPPGETRVVTLSGELVSNLSGTLTMPASVESANGESAPADNAATETTTVIGAPGSADLFMTVEETADPVTAGEAVTYRVTVINLGPNLAEEVTINATPEAVFSTTMSTGCVEDPSGWPICGLGSLAPGVPVTVELQGTLDITASGSVIQAFEVSSTTDDPNTANNSDSESTTIDAIGLADLQVTFSEASATAAPGGTATYEVTVANLGPDQATDVNVATVFTGPAGTSTTTGCAGDPNGAASCDLGTLDSGASVTFTVELAVNAIATMDIVVTSTVSSALEDTDMANNTAMATTMIDTTPPVVTKIDTVGATGGGSLEDCEEARVEVTQLLVTFNEPMSDPAGDNDVLDVTNPANYNLVNGGADRNVTTDLCGGALGDDALVPVASVTYNAGTSTATLDLGGALPDGPYRLLVCDTVMDEAGNSLDGDDNGVAGTEFDRYFRVDTSNLFIEGNFDCDLTEWSEVATADTEITYTAFDVDSAQTSGATVIYNNLSTADFSIGQCVEIERAVEHTMDGMVWLRDLEADVMATKTCEFFPQAGCAGMSSAIASDSEMFTAPSGTWVALSTSTLGVPAGTVSALCSLDLNLADTNAELTVLVDDLRLVPSEILFLDGFETGDTSLWDATVDP